MGMILYEINNDDDWDKFRRSVRDKIYSEQTVPDAYPALAIWRCSGIGHGMTSETGEVVAIPHKGPIKRRAWIEGFVEAFRISNPDY